MEERRTPITRRSRRLAGLENTAKVFDGPQPGDLVVYRWDTPRPHEDDLSEYYIYVFGDDGRWYPAFILPTLDGA